ncbi:MAG: hypothetical protein LBR93_08860 [Treponema sp.]|jgi:TPR repeat protein|nr:hypothetical protein [Treponema sp.]
MRNVFYVFLLNCFICLVLTSCSSSSKYAVKDPISAYNLAQGYFDNQDYTQAAYWWGKAAEQGDAQAQYI